MLKPPFVDEAPPDRYCDLVLTGGVTSGVVYPTALVELARHYRFKSIGGTSAGAMAAALAAAAEYQRRKGSLLGFQGLGLVPAQLAEDVSGMTRLLSLFNPTRGTRRLFNLFLGLLNRSGSAALLGLVAREYWGPLLVPALLVPTLAHAFTPHWHGALLGLALWLPLAALGVVLALLHDLQHGLVDNGFGLCKGCSKDPAHPALTDWLHEGIQALAGRRGQAPLTFQDLWQADEPPAWLKGPDGRAGHAIDLQMFTTNLTHGRPYRLPADGLSSRLFFRKEDLDSYFPDEVIAHLMAASQPYAPRLEGDPPASDATAAFRELPQGQLPVVVAARLSLSFPFLFSAVPLWAIDYEPPGAAQRTLRRCWFSDGGICSNFPIHLFDAFIPRWPTFGISLGRRGPFQKRATWLPTFHNQGRGDSWDRFGDERELPDGTPRSPLARLAGFAAGIVQTAKDWNDNTLMRMPGVRDRVVRIGFLEGEGELNIRLTGAEILRLATEYGTTAGQALVAKFVAPGHGGIARAWKDHRWVRFNTLLSALRARVSALSAAADATPHTEPLTEQIAASFVDRPLLGERAEEAPLDAAQADALDGLLEALKDLERRFAALEVEQPYRADPAMELRNRPPV